MAKKYYYYVEVIENNGTPKFVTSLGDHHTAFWNDNEKPKAFSKEIALDMCQGFAWNGICAFTVIMPFELTEQLH